MERSQTGEGGLHDRRIYDSMKQVKKMLRIYFKFMIRSDRRAFTACPDFFEGSMRGLYKGT